MQTRFFFFQDLPVAVTHEQTPVFVQDLHCTELGRTLSEVKCLHVNKREKLNDERNTFKIETMSLPKGNVAMGII